MSAAPPRLHRFAGFHLPAVLWAALVAAALAAPGDALPRFSDRISLGPFLDPLFDKIVHFVLFAGVAATCARSYRVLDPAGRLGPLARRPLGAACVTAIAYGGATELAQLGVGGRTAELGDFVADGAGAVVAVAVLAAAHRLGSTPDAAGVEAAGVETGPLPR